MVKSKPNDDNGLEFSPTLFLPSFRDGDDLLCAKQCSESYYINKTHCFVRLSLFAQLGDDGRQRLRVDALLAQTHQDGQRLLVQAGVQHARNLMQDYQTAKEKDDEKNEKIKHKVSSFERSSQPSKVCAISIAVVDMRIQMGNSTSNKARGQKK